MKKIMISLITIFVSLICLGSVEAASGKYTNNGKITINSAVTGQTYSIYQILELDSYDTEKGAYLYKVDKTSSWYKFLTKEEGKNYVNIDSNNIVTFKEGKSAATFASIALEYIKANNIKETAKKVATTDKVSFSNLYLGYYLVDSSLGSLCNLTTTNPTVEINEKNGVVTILKEVKEDQTNLYGKTNKSQLGDTVNFKTTITVANGAENYKLYDVMEKGLTFKKESLVVVLIHEEKNTTLTKDVDYSFSEEKGYTFVIDFSKSLEDSLVINDTLVVTYDAILNENATILDKGNKNETYLTYGDDNKTKVSETRTYTGSFNLIKTDSELEKLDGAIFELYDAKVGGNKINLIKISDNVYHIATESETKKEEFVSAKIVAGNVTINGLDDDTTYYLEEVESPLGFNPLVSRIPVKLSITIDSLNQSKATLEGTSNVTIKYNDSSLTVINTKGNLLPSTGGIGTKIFTVVGLILILVSGLMLVTKMVILKNKN